MKNEGRMDECGLINATIYSYVIAQMGDKCARKLCSAKLGRPAREKQPGLSDGGRALHSLSDIKISIINDVLEQSIRINQKKLDGIRRM
jgi:hypothetical protein